MEARDAFDDLATVAQEATRSPHRRKLSRKAAIARYRRARAALDWLLGMRRSDATPPPSLTTSPIGVTMNPLTTKVTPAPPASGPRS